MNKDLRQEIDKKWYCQRCGGCGYVPSKEILPSPCEVCHTAGHGGIQDLLSLVCSHLEKKMPKEIHNTELVVDGQNLGSLLDDGHNQAISEIKQILRKELIGK